MKTINIETTKNCISQPKYHVCGAQPSSYFKFKLLIYKKCIQKFLRHPLLNEFTLKYSGPAAKYGKI